MALSLNSFENQGQTASGCLVIFSRLSEGAVEFLWSLSVVRNLRFLHKIVTPFDREAESSFCLGQPE